MDIQVLSFFVAGLVLLIAGAEFLVRGASKLASFIGISPLVIGLTVVAFGTSAAELAVSIQSALAGQADITLGNVLGSNIFNVLFVLGVLALLTPLAVSRQLLRFDMPVMVIASVMAVQRRRQGGQGRGGCAFCLLHPLYLIPDCHEPLGERAGRVRKGVRQRRTCPP